MTTTALNKSELLGYSNTSTPPPELSDPVWTFSEVFIHQLIYTSSTYFFDLIALGVFYYYTATRRVGKSLVKFGQIAALCSNTSIIISLAFKYMFRSCDDVVLCMALNYFTIINSFRANLVYNLAAIEGISHNIRKRDRYLDWNDLLLYSILASLIIVCYNAFTGLYIIQNVYNCCNHHANCNVLHRGYTIFFGWLLPHGLVWLLLRMDIAVMDHRHVVGGNYKSPAKYNEDRDVATTNSIDYGIYLIGLTLYALSFHLGIAMCASVSFPAVATFVPLGLRLIIKEFQQERYGKNDPVPHDRRRRRNRMRQERLDRIAANNIEQEQIAARRSAATADIYEDETGV